MIAATAASEPRAWRLAMQLQSLSMQAIDGTGAFRERWLADGELGLRAPDFGGFLIGPGGCRVQRQPVIPAQFHPA